MTESWENEFLRMMDNKLPPTPRPIKVAIVENTNPIEINLGGLLYEQAKGEVLFNEALLMHEEKDVTLTNPAWEQPIQCEKVKHNKITLKVGDRVAVVALEGSQQILTLCKVVS